MKSLPENLYTPEHVAALDKIAIEQHGIPGYTLMRRAGRAVFDCLIQNYPETKNILVCCGAGNNAGDGYVVARLAHQHGLDVNVISLIDTQKLKGDAARACQHWLECGQVAAPDRSLIDHADVIVDALLGTGLQREVSGEWAQWIDAINAAGKTVVAVDVPSGLNAATGAIAGSAIHASDTVSFIGLKQGLFTASGKTCCGRVHFDDLELPAAVFDTVSTDARLLVNTKYLTLPPRSHDTHKGRNGHVLIPGGNSGMPGAVILCARAALRAGAGLVSVVTLPKHIAAVAAACPECMVHASANGEIAETLLESASHIAIGPGLGRDAWAQRLLYQVLATKTPLVLDADALNNLAGDSKKLHRAQIITPHPGEAARLLNTTTAVVQQDRFEAARQCHELTGAVVVLKGSGTLIYDGETMQVCPWGNPAMATAGMGDTLTGMISALMAQGLATVDAAATGVCLHAWTADCVADGRPAGVLASDIIDAMPRVALR